MSIEIVKPRSKPFIAATWYRPGIDLRIHLLNYSLHSKTVGKLDADGKEYYING